MEKLYLDIISEITEMYDMRRAGIHAVEITIRGTGSDSGKTHTQLALAEFLHAEGHSVVLSDDTCSRYILGSSLRRERAKDRPIPMQIHLRVSAETIDVNDAPFPGPTLQKFPQ